MKNTLFIISQRKWSRINFFIKLFFLFLTPTMFRYFNFAFIWHSFYWRTVTVVILIWGFFLLISPFMGRIGCGWFCFFGTIHDLVSQHSFHEIRRKKPSWVIRWIFLTLFLFSLILVNLLRRKAGAIQGWTFDPFFLNVDFNLHYKHIWMYDTVGIVLFGLLLGRRGACRNTCFMGALCGVGSKFARLLVVVDKNRCKSCDICETVCTGKVPIRDYIEHHHGLVNDTECMKCGACIDACRHKAMSFKMVWNRKKYLRKLMPKLN